MLGLTAHRLLWGIALAATCGCGGTTTEQVIGPTAARCQLTLTPSSPVLPASGSTVLLDVAATRDCAWTAASDAPWLTVNPTSGQGPGAVSVVAAANAQPSARTAGVAVNDTRVTVSQEPAPCRFELGDQSARVEFEGGRLSVRVITMDGCEWRVSGAVGWVQVLTPSGAGSGTVDVGVNRNDGPERSVTLSIAGNSFVLVQDGVRSATPPNPSPNPTPSPSTCSFSIDPEAATIRSAAGQGSVRVLTEPGCSWTAATSTPWISLQRSGGSGPESLTYQFFANSSTVSGRSGSIAVAGRTHGVTQAACELTIDGGSPNLGPNDGSYDFRITTDSGCVWNASSNVEWISLTRSSGTGSSVLAYRISANTTTRDRSGSIVVSGRTKVIIQQALGQGGP
jgi:hypothetical protein